MSPERVWSDVYGSARALWAGLPGGHRWLIVCPPRHAGAAISALNGLRFKGSVHFIVTDDLTPVEAAVREVEPRGVLVVGETLRGGDEVSVAERLVDLEGFAYREGGKLPGWESALKLDAPRGACAAASLCALRGVGVVSAAPGDVGRVLHMWWAQTPHSLAHVS